MKKRNERVSTNKLKKDIDNADDTITCRDSIKEFLK